MRTLTTTATLAALACGWGYWFFGHASRHSSKPFSTAHLAAFDDIVEPAAFVPNRAENGLQVFGEDEAECTDAELWRAPVGSRSLDKQLCHLLTRADARGTVAWPDPLLVPGTELILRAPGRRAAIVPADLVGRPLRALLRQGHTLDLLCTDDQGKPLSGALVALSRANWTTSPEAGPDLVGAGGDVRSAIHVARSDADGRARIEGLARARYAINVEHPTHVVYDGLPGLSIDVPQSALSLKMVGLVGCVLTPPPGDQIEITQLASAARSTTRVATMTSVENIQAALTAKFPGNAAIALPPRTPGQPQTVEGTMLLRQRGWCTFTAQLVPVGEIQPREIASDTPVQAMASFRLDPGSLNNAAGWVPRALRMRHRETGLDCYFELALGQSFSVPPGTYAIESIDTMVNNVLPDEPFTLAPGADVALRLRDRGLHLARLAVRDRNGRPVGPSVIEISQGEQVLHTIRTWDSVDESLTLPGGPVKLRVTAFGYQPSTRTLQIPEDIPSGVIDWRIDYAQ